MSDSLRCTRASSNPSLQRVPFGSASMYSFSYHRLLARLPHINPTSQRATREANGRLAHIQRWRPRCRRAHASPRASSSGARASTPRPERGSRDAPVPLGSAYQQPAANSRSPPTTRGLGSRPGRRATPTPWIQTAGISRASLPYLRHAHGEQRRTLAPTPCSVWRAARASSCGAARSSSSHPRPPLSATTCFARSRPSRPAQSDRGRVGTW